MGWLRRVRGSIRGWPARDTLEEELNFHLEERVDAYVREGMAPAAARLEARRRFGSVALAKDRARDEDTLRWLTDSLDDLRYAARTLLKAPTFAAVAILTLALGIGANTAVFGILDGYWRPLPVPNADRIVVIAAGLPGDDTGMHYQFSFQSLEDYRQEADVFQDVFGFAIRISGLTVDGKTSQFVHHIVTGNFFSGLQLTPAAGRLFAPGEGERPGDEVTVVLGYDYWQRRFGGDPRIVGTILMRDARPARVVGVAPRGFHGLFEGADMDGYLVLSNSDAPGDEAPLLTERGYRSLTMAARLRPGVGIRAAQARAEMVNKHLADAYPDTEGHTTVRVMPETLARPIPIAALTRLQPVVKTLMFTLAGLVLLIACMNVANLMLVRAGVRQREMAVRAALGSGTGRLIRLVMAEGFVLALCGAAAGALAGIWAIHLLLGSIDVSTTVPVNLDMHIDWRVFAYAMALAVATGVLVSILPALRASGVNVMDLLHDGGRGSSGGRQRLRSILVVAQVAGSLVLLVLAGLFVRNLQRTQALDLGFQPDHVFTARLSPGQIGYDESRTMQFYDELDRRIHRIAGVESAAQAFTVPLSYITGGGTTVIAEGEVERKDEPRPAILYNTVSPEYFSTLRLPIIRGRAFTDRDLAASPLVAIVNETFAARTWPNQNPIGKRIKAGGLSEDHFWEVVGVARDSKYVAAFETPLPHFYVPTTQVVSDMRVLIVRSSLSTEATRTAVEQAVASIDPNMPLADVDTMTHVLAGNFGIALLRVGAVQAAELGLLGLVLSVIGIYGVVSYGASRRTREIGIRLALGAEAKDVRRMVLVEGAKLVLIGVAVGLVATLAVARTARSLLVFVSVTDPFTFVLVTALLVAVALVACYLPARRATRVDPMTVLRAE